LNDPVNARGSVFPIEDPVRFFRQDAIDNRKNKRMGEKKKGSFLI
jgi:hypothetical protein